MSDGFFKVLENERSKVADRENVKSIPCLVQELLGNERVRVKTISTNAEYIVPNRSGNDVLVGENVSLFYQGNIINEGQAYIGSVLNKRSSKYYTKPETDDMLNGMSIEKMSKAEYDALPVKNPNRVYFVYNPDNSYDIYIGTIKINGEGGGYENLPVHIKAKIQECLESESVVVDFKTGTLSDDIEFATTNNWNPYGNCELSIKPRSKCLLLAFAVYYIEDESECYKRFEEAGLTILDKFYTYDANSEYNPNPRYGIIVLGKNSNGSTTTLKGNGNITPYHRFSNVTFVAIYNTESVTVTHCGNGNSFDSYTYSYYVQGDSKPYKLWKGFKAPMASKPCIYYCSQASSGNQKGVFTQSVSGLDEYSFDVELHSTMMGLGGHFAYNGEKTSLEDLLWIYASYSDTTSVGVQHDAEGSPYPHSVGLITVEINERSETE